MSRLLVGALLGFLMGTGTAFDGPLNTDCDVSEDALDNLLPGVSIPRSCFNFRGSTRCFYTYVPDCASGETPLILDLHPFITCPSFYAGYSGWLQLAREQCFAIVLPVGNTDPNEVSGICWAVPAGNRGIDADEPFKETDSCCCIDFNSDDPLTLDTEAIGDLEFVREAGVVAVEEIAATTNNQVVIDTKRIYVTGHSNGCYAAFGMAMRHSDFVAGTACMSGLWITPPDVSYTPVPMWSLIGGVDPIAIPIGVDAFGIFIPSFLQSFQGVRDLNNCTGFTTVSERIRPMDTFFSNGILRTRTAQGCANGAVVEFLELSTAGHTPFRNTPEIFPDGPFASDTTVDTTRLAWNFLVTKQRSDEPPEFQSVDTPQVAPTLAPVPQPTLVPFSKPTISPTVSPTVPPTVSPTARPTAQPTLAPQPGPTIPPFLLPTEPTVPPGPTEPTLPPFLQPQVVPTLPPILQPGAQPTLPPFLIDASQSGNSQPGAQPTLPPFLLDAATQPTLPPIITQIQQGGLPTTAPVGSLTAQPTEP